MSHQEASKKLMSAKARHKMRMSIDPDRQPTSLEELKQQRQASLQMEMKGHIIVNQETIIELVGKVQKLEQEQDAQARLLQTQERSIVDLKDQVRILTSAVQRLL